MVVCLSLLWALLPRPSSATNAAAKAARRAPSRARLEWHTQPIDHFQKDAAPPPVGCEPTFEQRLFVSEEHFRPRDGGVILFYTGNEGDVTLYVNHTGLIWENAESLGALVVFAEHRYYGETKPSCVGDGGSDLRYLRHEQALADYKRNVETLRDRYDAHGVATVVLGGSYGGMLSAWMRMTYPDVVDGAIASSAPILAFPPPGGGGATTAGATPPEGERFDTKSYWKIVTDAARPSPGGAADRCASNVREAWGPLFELAETTSGRDALRRAFKLCEAPKASGGQSPGERVAYFAMMAFDTLAMGNFPFPSNYLTSGGAVLPAHPVRRACEHLVDASLPSNGDSLVEALGRASLTLYDPDGSEACVDLPDDLTYDGIWDYQYCTELLPQETYFARDGVSDMFWPSPYDREGQARHCEAKYGVRPDATLILDKYGGLDGVRKATNLVLSNGLLDPWSSGGVVGNLTGVHRSVVALSMPNGAHHSDLFFGHDRDTPDVREARLVEIMHIRKWAVEGHKGKAAFASPGGAGDASVPR